MRPQSPPRQDLSQWIRVLLATILICSALSLGSVLGVTARTMNPAHKTKTVYDPIAQEYIQVATEQAVNPLDIIRSFAGQPLDRKVNILLLGSDYNYIGATPVDERQTGQRTRTDTIMVASIDPVNEEVNILSIPRDTYALLTGYHYDKINAAMTYGGVDLVKSTVTDLTGIPIDYYMALKVDGLINTVDVLGGIRIYVEKDMYYVDETAHLGINIHKGWKEAMNGEQANQYVRFRKDELGDIGRVQRQQKFIRAVVDKMLKPSSWLKIPALLEHMNENIETDMPSELVGQLIHFGTSLDKENLHMAMLPGYFGDIGGISFWRVSHYQARKLISDMFPESALNSEESGEPVAEETLEEAKARFRVSMWNATDDLRVGREIVRRLREAGWYVHAIRRAPHDTPVTKIIAQTGQSQYLRQLQDVIGFQGERITASVGDIATDFTVLIGEDLVKHMNKNMTEEDWAEAMKQPMPAVYFNPTPQYTTPAREVRDNASAQAAQARATQRQNPAQQPSAQAAQPSASDSSRQQSPQQNTAPSTPSQSQNRETEKLKRLESLLEEVQVETPGQTLRRERNTERLAQPSAPGSAESSGTQNSPNESPSRD